MTNPPVRALVLRIEQLDTPEHGIVKEPTNTPVAYRLDGVPLCVVHVQELRAFVLPTRAVRRVLSPDEIESLVVEFGLNRDDIRRLHGQRDGETCVMCPTLYVEGNVCGSCKRPLHPKWPAVYCSDDCALRDL